VLGIDNLARGLVIFWYKKHLDECILPKKTEKGIENLEKRTWKLGVVRIYMLRCRDFMSFITYVLFESM
jgi:hypothetical protein